MKKRFIIFGGALALSACTGAGVSGQGVSLGLGLGGMLGNHVGIGTSVNIPLGKTSSVGTTAPAFSEQTIYFDAKGQMSDAAVKNGFYRKVLAKQSDGVYLVQDFYEMGGSKRTDPMQLQAAQLHTFRATPDNGTLTVYDRQGAVMQQQTFQNGKLIK